MKPDSTRAATARVLADIDAAVRPVERARTAAAVDRVLTSASPGCSELWAAWCEVTSVLLGADIWSWPDDQCPHCTWMDNVTDEIPQFSSLRESRATVVTEYAPWNVSPHLFPTDPS